MKKINAIIKGVGGYVPDYILTNKELETIVDTSSDWILERTGIEERRILKGEGLGSSFMGTKAVQELLAKTNTNPLDIDLLICSTTTPDFIFPATANLISDDIGAKNAFSFDMQAACSGFLYAMTVGSQFIETGRYKKVVVVGADKMSSIVDYTDRTTCIIFGDGAAAVLLEPDMSDEGLGFQDAFLKVDGSGWKHLHQKAGGSRRPPSVESVQNREHFVYQEGQPVFKNAVTKMADAAALVMERNHLKGDDVAFLVPHQANKRIIDATANRMGVGHEKVMLNIQKYGNTTNATLGLCLKDYESRLKKGDNIIFAAFGGGFTWGATYWKWAYDGDKVK
ncbi:MAG: ketoacyl-ACP synthase III [Cytophagia bacterium]|nr:MAG: ketoacyl-ACP synthase III [Cytophagia bacterium]TAG44233.1 MAG: ketoacyl-ACP synthase III [Cytophagia bacterium]TAH29125.1 MAG: ketoacyl-ACP synthase III [Cytophagales bacterium]